MLAELTGLSRATISVAISDLIDRGIVQETEKRQRTGGRPATVLELTSGTATIIGAEFDNDRWILGAFDLIGNPVHSIVIPVPIPTPVTAFGVLSEHLKPFIASLENPVPLISLGLPGLVDSNSKNIIAATDIGWHNINVEKYVQWDYDWPLITLNRHKARGLYECRFGAGQDLAELASLGTTPWKWKG